MVKTLLTQFLVPLLLLLFICGQTHSVRAQGENNYWHFGGGTLHFQPTGPVVIQGRDLHSEEGSASVSDANGNLLFYTDGSTIFNRNHQPMPHGQRFGSPYQYSATQGALIVKAPGSSTRYYVFRVGAHGAFPVPFVYLEVDMTLEGGLGDVIGSYRNISPDSRLSEKMTGVAHSNGRDTWVLVHGFRDSNFYAFLVSPAGVSPTPVVTTVGTSFGSGLYYENPLGYLRASPNGTKLAQAIASTTTICTLELLDFDATTGIPSNPSTLASQYNLYGVEFSEDGSKLYSTAGDRVYQYNLLGNSLADIKASQSLIAEVFFQNSGGYGGAYALQRGPDEKIYVAQDRNYLGVIPSPNVQGIGCGYIQQGVALIGVQRYGLPNFPNQVLNENKVLARIATQTTCIGSPIQFTGSTTPAVAGATYEWNFGEQLATGPTTALGSSVTHQYTAPGTYLVKLKVTAPGKPVATTTAIVTLAPAPVISLGATQQQICLGDTRVLQAQATTPDVSFRWQDGSTAAQYTVRSPGTYWVEATSAQGCSSRSTVTFTLAPTPQFTLGVDTTICTTETLTLRPKGVTAPSSYVWQDGSTNSSYTATVPGTYWVEIRNSAGCSKRDSVLVSPKPCIVSIPNIITPNGDRQNEYFVLKGMRASEWALTIYNRWGKKVYETPSYDNKWNAIGQEAGVYFYQLRREKDSETYKGWVQVVR